MIENLGRSCFFRLRAASVWTVAHCAFRPEGRAGRRGVWRGVCPANRGDKKRKAYEKQQKCGSNNYMVFSITLCHDFPLLAIAVGTQMRLFFHLQDHGRKILLRSFARLPRVDLKSSTRGGHSRANGSREIQNQPEILVH